MTAFPMNRRLFGDLYPDVETLALAGKIVTRVGSNFRVDSNPEILTAAQIRGMAAKERNRKWEAANAPARGCDGHEITRKTPERAASPPQGKPCQVVSKATGAGRPATGDITKPARLDTPPGGGGAAVAETTKGIATPGHHGSTSTKAIEDATPRECENDVSSVVPPDRQSQTAGVPPAASSVTPAITAGIVAGSNIAQASKGKGVKWVAPPRVCERCGGPRSYWSAAFCKGCFQIKRQPGPTQERRIQALEQRTAELEATVARLLGQLAMEGGR